MPGRGVHPAPRDYQSPPGYFIFGPVLINGTPDKRYEHPLLLAPATLGPPDSGKTGLGFFAICPLLSVLAQRKPILLLRSSGSLLLRMAQATF